MNTADHSTCCHGPVQQLALAVVAVAFAPSGADEATVREAATAEGIVLVHHAQCWQRPEPLAGIIIGFGATPTTQLSAALKALQHVLEA